MHGPLVDRLGPLMHGLLVTCHAVAASVALLTGLAAFRFPVVVAVHAAATVLMALTLDAALRAGATGSPAALEAVFVGLLVLGIGMAGAAVRAWRHRPAAGDAPSPAYLASLGFVCIGLVTGLAAVGAVRLGWGVPAIVAASVLPTLVGRMPLNRALRRAVQRDATPPATPSQPPRRTP